MASRWSTDPPAQRRGSTPCDPADPQCASIRHATSTNPSSLHLSKEWATPGGPYQRAQGSQPQSAPCPLHLPQPRLPGRCCCPGGSDAFSSWLTCSPCPASSAAAGRPGPGPGSRQSLSLSGLTCWLTQAEPLQGHGSCCASCTAWLGHLLAKPDWQPLPGPSLCQFRSHALWRQTQGSAAKSCINTNSNGRPCMGIPRVGPSLGLVPAATAR